MARRDTVEPHRAAAGSSSSPNGSRLSTVAPPRAFRRLPAAQNFRLLVQSKVIVECDFSRDRNLIAGNPALEEVCVLLHILQFHKAKWIPNLI
jgi:hypothetical protein